MNKKLYGTQLALCGVATLSVIVAIMSACAPAATPTAVPTNAPAPTKAAAIPVINDSGGGLVGAWLVSVARATGPGVVLLTFTSDGTFFRSGDTHPVLSVAHGVWKRISDREYDATYIALRFDDNKKFVGSQKTRIRITRGTTENEFSAVAKVSTLDLDGKEVSASESQLAGKRIQVEPF